MGIAAALQQTAAPGGATLTLGTWGVLGLLALAAGGVAGWVLYLLTRRDAPLRPPEPAPPAAPAPASPAEEPLEALYLRALEGGADGTVLCRGGRIRKAESRHGLLPGDATALAGRPLTALVAAEDVLPVAEALRRGLPAGGETTIRFTLQPSPGVPPRHVAARLLAPPGAPAGDWVAILSDRTDATAVARAASGVARRVTVALEQVPDAVILTAVDHGTERVSLANSAAGDLLRMDPAALAGREMEEIRARASQIFAPGTGPRLFPEVSAPGEDRIDVEGEDRRHLMRTMRDLGGEGQHGGRLYVIRDVTESHAREQELRESEREARKAWASLEERQEQILMANEGLERRIADFTRFNRELKVIDEMKSNFLANVSHELQTPLVSIKGYTEMVLKGRLGPLTAEQERGLKVALKNVDRLIGLIDSLLAFVRTEKDSEPLKVEAFSLRELVDETVELLKERAESRGISLTVQFPSGDLTVRADRNRIAQVFINLVGNAIKYNRDRGRVEIEAARGSRSNVRVEIRDTGLGIPREDLDRIFDRYYRSAASGDEGTGLGLAIARDILRLHGCQIRADSEHGKGSVFSFTLPLEGRGKAELAPRLAGTDREEG